MARADRVFMLIALCVVLAATLIGSAAYLGSHDDDIGETVPELSTAGRNSPSHVTRHQGSRRANPNENVSESTPAADSVDVVSAGSDSIAGTVLDHEGLPLEGVQVRSTMHFPIGRLNYGLIDEHETEVKTNREGRFLLKVPPQGVYRLEFHHRAFAPHREAMIEPGADLKVQLEIGAAIRGTVTSAATKKPLEGVKISVRQGSGDWKAQTTTDDEGAFVLYGLPVDGLFLTAELDNYLPLRNHIVRTRKGAFLDAPLSLETGKTIRGVVVDEQGRWIEGAVIKIGGRKTRGDDFGRFSRGGLESITHPVEVYAEGYLTLFQQVNLAGSRETAELEITLHRGGTLRMEVIDEKGRALPGIEVKAFQTWGGRSMWAGGNTRHVAVTDSDGRATITGISLQQWTHYTVRAWAEGWAPTFSERISLTEKEKEKDITLVMRPGGGITGRVMDESQRGLKGAKVILSFSDVHEWGQKKSRTSKAVLTDKKGNFTFHDLAARRYRLVAMAPGYATRYRGDLEVSGSGTTEGIELILASGDVIEGKVTSEEGAPIEGATVTFSSRNSWGRGMTDKEGHYKVTNLGVGPYTAQARASGYSTNEKREAFPEDGRIDFELSHDGYAWGQVIDKTTEKPVPRFTVSLQKPRRGRQNSWSTRKRLNVEDSEGRFKIFAADDTYRLQIESRGHIIYQKEGVTVHVNSVPQQLKVTLIPGGAIEGWVRDHNGEVVPHTSIFLRKFGGPAEEGFRRVGNTESDGYFFIQALETGSYEVAFMNKPRIPLTIQGPVTVFAGEIAMSNVTAARPGQVSIAAALADGKPSRSWCRIRVTSLNNRPLSLKRVWRNGAVNWESSFQRSEYLYLGRNTTIGGLPAGVYRLEATYRNFAPWEEEIEIRGGRTEELEINFKKKRREATSR